MCFGWVGVECVLVLVSGLFEWYGFELGWVFGWVYLCNCLFYLFVVMVLEFVCGFNYVFLSGILEGL